MDDVNLKEELRSRQHFLVDCGLEQARHKIFIYAVESLNGTVVNKKLQFFFQRLKVCSKSEPCFSVPFEDCRRRKFQTILRTRKQ